MTVVKTFEAGQLAFFYAPTFQFATLKLPDFK
jgi:hypothetical protein